MRQAAERIVRRLNEAGFRALFAGGCVRDLLLGETPADYDVATSAPPEEVERIFAHTVKVGAKFGVVLVREETYHFEVATFRKESGYSDGRRPDAVEFSGEIEDAQRRDFTVNGLFYDPLSARVLDYVGGQEDLKAGVVRAIGDPEARLAEDRLRMLRAIRFAARLGFCLEERTWQAVCANAPKIAEIAPERLGEELLKMLTGPHPERSFELLHASGLLVVILPEVAALVGVPQPPAFHPEGDVWTHTLLALQKLPPAPPPALALAVLLHDVGKPPTYAEAERIRFDRHAEVGAEMARKVCRRLRFPGELTDTVADLVATHMYFLEVRRLKLSRLKRFLSRDHFDLHLELHRIDCLASHGSLENYDFVRQALERLPEEERQPARLIGGEDLIALGLAPGPVFGRILEAVREAQLEGEITRREEALALARRLAEGNRPEGERPP